MCINHKEEHEQLNEANQQREIVASNYRFKSVIISYQWFTNYRITGKFDGGIKFGSLAVWVETAKLKSISIIFVHIA